MSLGIGIGIGVGIGDKAASFSPSDISGLTLWLKADAEANNVANTTLATDTQTIAQWKDQSGNSNHATQGTEADKPTWLATGGPNSKPAVKFDGAFANQSFVLPNGFSALTSGEIFFVIKTDADPSVSFGGYMSYFGSDGQGEFYPYSDGIVYSSFGSTVLKTVGNLTPGLNSWRVFNVISASGEFTANLDGTEVYTTGTNTVGFTTAPTLGKNPSSVACFAGRMSEVIIYNAKLSAGNRTLVKSYLATKYALTIA